MNQHEKAHHTVGTTGILIDGFKFRNPRVTAYFLTHFHSDHYSGLDEGFPWENDVGAKLYCSPITAALVEHKFEVRKTAITVIPMDTPTRVLDFTVTLIAANHCPGAAMLLFDLADGRRVLHTGDMRYSPTMLTNPHLMRAAGLNASDIAAIHEDKDKLNGKLDAGKRVSGMKRRRGDGSGIIDELYLDTTYSHPKHTFPSQQQCIQDIVDIVAESMADKGEGAESHAASPLDAVSALYFPCVPPQTAATTRETKSEIPSNNLTVARDTLPARPFEITCDSGVCTVQPSVRRTRDTLVLVSTYLIGKERILVALARQLRLRVYTSMSKLQMVQHLGLSQEDLAYFTARREGADVHVVGMHMCGRSFPYFQPDFQRMLRYMEAVNKILRELAGVQGGAGAEKASESVPSEPTGPMMDEDAEDEAFLQSSQGSTHADAPRDGDSKGIVDITQYKRVIGIVPTGWVFKSKKKVFERDNAAVYLTPYSEHSSFPELTEFVEFLRPRKIIPTVFENEAAKRRIEGLFAHLIDHTAAKKAFLGNFLSGKPDVSPVVTSPAADTHAPVAREPSSSPFRDSEEIIIDGIDDISEAPAAEKQPSVASEVTPDTESISIIDEDDLCSYAKTLGADAEQSTTQGNVSKGGLDQAFVYRCYACEKEFSTRSRVATCAHCHQDFIECIRAAQSPAPKATPSRQIKSGTLPASKPSPSLLEYFRR